MNYFYDILINLNDIAYNFYEWSKDDSILHLKKIPVFKINTKELKDLLKYNIKIDKNFLDNIYNKTESYETNNKYIEYMALFTDENNSLVIEFDQNGKSLYRSKLLLEEELDLLEMAYSLKKENITYEKLNLLPKTFSSRQENEIKHFLEIEIKTLYENKQISKLRYLYNETFNQDNKNLDLIYQKLLKKIKSDFSLNHLKLFEIVKLSYKHLST